MLLDFIKKKIRNNFPHVPTKEQENVMHILAEFIHSNNHVLVVKGYAGTGKTSVIASFVQTLVELSIPSFLMAPTGRAAKVLSYYTKTAATTIHKTIYRQASTHNGIQKFSLYFNAHAQSVFIVDEVSMLANNSFDKSMFGSGLLLNDLFEFVFENDKNCKLILIGDTAQLPPVGLSVSPALDVEYLSTTFFKQIETAHLYEVVRQQKESGILALATEIRTIIENNSCDFPHISQTSDVIPITGDILLEHLESSYSSVGEEHTIVITRSNKYANKYNQGIRAMVLWRESQINVGDFIMVVKNNYYWSEKSTKINFIANGDIAEITHISQYENLYGFAFANVRLRFVDYDNEELDVKILLQTLESESPALSYDDNTLLYTAVQEDYQHITSARARYQEIRKNEYFNALQIKYAYAITCHKAQGGQWKHVYIDHGYLPENTTNVDFLRWLYTACTRATERLYLVNFKKEFFE
ncbi:MAG: AAA family ATPase [Bacteroidales bacterium]|nr:AAA family ATPase [Bacteroidales bacterium]NLK82435.1 AAA family ATPase [Bacteroidales bacterium]HPY82525.1 AAA family ATPase [Bacteroidales bacterium]